VSSPERARSGGAVYGREVSNTICKTAVWEKAERGAEVGQVGTDVSSTLGQSSANSSSVRSGVWAVNGWSLDGGSGVVDTTLKSVGGGSPSWEHSSVSGPASNEGTAGGTSSTSQETLSVVHCSRGHGVGLIASVEGRQQTVVDARGVGEGGGIDGSTGGGGGDDRGLGTVGCVISSSQDRIFVTTTESVHSRVSGVSAKTSSSGSCAPGTASSGVRKSSLLESTGDSIVCA